ncbi:MAG: signal peptidase II [Patescibacteria group bacterium]
MVLFFCLFFSQGAALLWDRGSAADVNNRVFWGLGGNNNIALIIAFSVVAVMIYVFGRQQKYRLPLGLVFGGIASNLIDRVWRGGVIDYWQIPALFRFNLADIFILAGLILLIRTKLRLQYE